MPSRILIVGCGYAGLPLALCLKGEGHEVSAWVHSGASAAALTTHDFHQVIIGSVADRAVWQRVDKNFDVVVHAASSGKGGEDAYREVFVQGVTLLNEHQPQARRLFVSSTSVYGQTGGEIVTEESSAEPTASTGLILRFAEEIAQKQGCIVVRSAGIYGPGRGVLFEKFRRGEAVIEGDGTRWLNMIHRDDLVSALAQLIDQGEPGQVYNVSDDSPVMLLEFYTWCAEFLNKPLPPHGPVNPNRKRGLTSKRVSNAKLRAIEWKPLYPSFREGLAADHSPK